ncbi:hypothetical protein DSO57_1000563 [Entomophthora muscae]|uniref:Uncharacterized protein n=1 Tax=Entomophthora muscae TaxID=34485 RepID=A0ACC2SB30_9FUNG|nr:hypothetical protein DSO57_1000563 [Entomophthora muscae]
MTRVTDDVKYMRLAVEQAKKCKPASGAYSVGAVLVKDGEIISAGYSRELEGNTHAEECALIKLASPKCAVGATLYTTMEPCSTRLSGKKSCTDRVLENKISNVIIGIKEPPNFVKCIGADTLSESGIHVSYLSELDAECRAPNDHLL